MRRISFFSLSITLLGIFAVSHGSSGCPAPLKTAARPAYPGQAPQPQIFADGIISTADFETHTAFTPDGKTIYFLKANPSYTFWTIYVSQLVEGVWTTPVVAPFSGTYSDADPFITPDGSKFFFISDRPVDGIRRGDLDIWVMDKMENGWSEPRNLGVPINSTASEWFPTVTADGTLYFGSGRPGGKGRTDLYRSRLVNEVYTEPENLGDAINTRYDEYEPLIAPDESHLIFMTTRPTRGSGGGDLFISFNQDGVWTPAKILGEPISTSALEIGAKISPDGKSFFFSSTRRSGYLGDIYYIDISALSLNSNKQGKVR